MKKLLAKVFSYDGVPGAVAGGLMALLVLGGNYLLLGRQPNRLTAAQAENIEQQNKPAITLTPTISQSDSVEDIREIRLRIVVTNVGGAEAELKKLQLVVSDGVPTDDAQQDLYLTQEFFNQRRNIVKMRLRLWTYHLSQLRKDTMITRTYPNWTRPTIVGTVAFSPSQIIRRILIGMS